MPPDDFAIVSAPLRSVMVIIVLLNDAKIWAIPHFRSAMIYVTLRRSLASRNRQFRGAGIQRSIRRALVHLWGERSLERLLCVLRLRYVRGQQVAWRAWQNWLNLASGPGFVAASPLNLHLLE